MSDFRPDTKWAVVDTFFFFLGSLVQSCCGERGTLQTNNTGVCSQCLTHTGFAPTRGVCAFPVYTAQALGLLCQEPSEAGPGLHAPPRSKPLRFWHSDSPQRQTQLGLHFVPFPGPSSSGDEVFGEHGCCDLSHPHPCHSLFWVYNQHTFSGRC